MVRITTKFMVNPKRYIISIIFILLFIGVVFLIHNSSAGNSEFVAYSINLRNQDLKLYWKNEKGVPFRSLGALKSSLSAKGKTLVFAMNGGMYKPDNSPQGLFIEAGELRTILDTTAGTGNFYMKPNGVFYTTTNRQGFVCRTEDFRGLANVLYATQSGPMLLINGSIHPAFKEDSKNLNIRNGVGILPNGEVLFAMSKEPVNFYDFALYFQKRGCKNALYLDGLVSRTYLPAENWEQLEGDFGVIIGVTDLSE